MDNSDRLSKWLMAQCEDQNLSWSEASRRAGLSPNSISEIVSGVKPGVKRLTALAEYFKVPREYLFQMAGLLPKPGNNGIPAEEQARIDHIIHVWQEVAELDPGSLMRLLNVVEGQAEMAKALLEAGRRLELPQEEKDRRSES